MKMLNKSVNPSHTLFYNKNNALYTNYTKKNNYSAIQNIYIGYFHIIPSEPVIIDYLDPTLIPAAITVGLTVTHVMYNLYRRNHRELEVWLKVAFVPIGDYHYNIIYDKSDLDGHKLRILYGHCDYVRGCYIRLHPEGPLVYGLISDCGPDDPYARVPNMDVIPIYLEVLGDREGDRYFGDMFFPGPSQWYWEELTSSMRVNINNKSDTGPDLWISPAMNGRNEFLMHIKIYRSTILQNPTFIGLA